MTNEKSIGAARCIPILASLDIRESEAFYTGHLGFSSRVYEEEEYLIVIRDGMEIHFWKTTNRAFPENTSCYIEGTQVADLWTEYSAKGVPGLSADFAVRGWGMAEFYVHDVHGNLLKFGVSADEIGMV